MKRVIIIFLLTVISSRTFGQSNFEKFKKLFRDHDTSAIKSLLSQWEATNPNDPEFYTSAFNYYFSKSKEEMLSIDKEPNEKEGLVLQDSTGKIAGYLNSNEGFNPKKLEKAFSYIDKGIEKFPDRLDMRFGKCYAFGKTEYYEKFTAEIINTIDYSIINKNNWFWTENKKLDDAENFLLDAVQDYLVQLYNTENDDLLENMKQIGERVLKHYPDCIKILSTTAIAYMLTKDYDKAIGHLKHAEQLDPKDYIVLNNIAEGYRRKGDKENAIKYYELTLKYGDEDSKQHAADQIKKMRN